MKSLINKIHPISRIFFTIAIFIVALGFATDFSNKLFHVIVVSGNVISGLLVQKYMEL